MLYLPARQHKASGIGSLEPIPGLHKRLQIRAHNSEVYTCPPSAAQAPVE
jgi:hypothetical protein